MFYFYLYLMYSHIFINVTFYINYLIIDTNTFYKCMLFYLFHKISIY